MNGPASPPQEDPSRRKELLERVEALHPVAALEGAQFVAGARLCIARGIAQDAAVQLLAELQAAGAHAAMEANRPPDDEILALDQVGDAGSEPDLVAALNEQMLAQLQSLDGDEPAASSAPASSARVQAPPPEPAAPVDDARFRPSGEWHQPMDLELDAPVRPAAPPPPPPSADASSEEEEAPPPVVDEEWHPVPGRIAQGALRKNPPVRIAIGVVAGLLLGWMFAQPYAHKAERRVAELRAQADAERYRPVEEAQARVRDLDRQADDASSSGALGMAVIWVLVGGAAFAGWWRAT